VTFVDGTEVLRTTLDKTVVTSPQAHIIEVGTASPAPPRNTAPAASRTRTPSEPPPPSDPPSEPEPEPTSTDSNAQEGEASYYYHPEEGMTAAHRTLPFGTVVTVTNKANGQSVNVTINDRGPYIEGRIIDLNEQAFTEIAAKSSGVIDVRITW
jgi:3D (Asp-Asp-Asp) domain-containing protein